MKSIIVKISWQLKKKKYIERIYYTIWIQNEYKIIYKLRSLYPIQLLIYLWGIFFIYKEKFQFYHLKIVMIQDITRIRREYTRVRSRTIRTTIFLKYI